MNMFPTYPSWWLRNWNYYFNLFSILFRISEHWYWIEIGDLTIMKWPSIDYQNDGMVTPSISYKTETKLSRESINKWWLRTSCPLEISVIFVNLYAACDIEKCEVTNLVNDNKWFLFKQIRTNVIQRNNVKWKATKLNINYFENKLN